jgi:hypothetical protein
VVSVHQASTATLRTLNPASQVNTLGGSAKLSKAACDSLLGTTLGTEEEEEFAQSMLQWACQREEELELVNTAAVMNHLMVQYATGAVRLLPLF